MNQAVGFELVKAQSTYALLSSSTSQRTDGDAARALSHLVTDPGAKAGLTTLSFSSEETVITTNDPESLRFCHASRANFLRRHLKIEN